ncbi:MAG: hypothetical protein ACOYMS_05915, partial [Terrimicrobiaceae bacterium]
GIAEADYHQNKFNITHYSRSPELNIFGEPRINLIQTDLDPRLTGAARPLRNMASVKPQTALYPTSLQLTGVFSSSNSSAVDATQGLAQQLTLRRHGLGQQSAIERNFSLTGYPGTGAGSSDATDYERNFWTLLRRITGYMEGRNSLGKPVAWPFAGGNFSLKYNDYQRDSIGLQIVDLMKAGTADLQWTYTDNSTYIDRMRSGPTVIPQAGALSNTVPPTKLVWGEGRSPKLTEVVMQIEANPGTEVLDATTYNVAKVKVAVWTELYSPRYANGDTNDDPYFVNASAFGRFRFGVINGIGNLNVNDIPDVTSSNGMINGPGAFGGYWANNLFRDFDQTGARAGIDFMRHYGDRPDPDQTNAAIMHPWKYNSTTYNGSGPNWSTGNMTMNIWAVGSTMIPAPSRGGTFNKSRNDLYDMPMSTRPNVTSLRFEGGISAVLTQDAAACFNFVPAHSLITPPGPAGQSWAGLRRASPPDTNAVLSLPAGVTLGVPGAATIHWQALDPLTSYFSKDWVVNVYPNFASTVPNITMSDLEVGVGSRKGNPVPYTYSTGVNKALVDQYGGFMNTIWWPAQRSGFSEHVNSGGAANAASWTPAPTNAYRREAAFPSVGFLQYLRTGVFPDGTLDEAQRADWKGTPFRVLNYGAETNANQRGGVPDWAILDLFQIPVINPAGGTAGGSTVGRINPNSPTSLYPWTNVSRTAPLAAVFQGLRVNQDLNQTTGAFSGGTEITPAMATDIAEGIGTYLTSLGRPFKMAAEIANVPEIAALSRNIGPLSGPEVSVMNDLVRQAVGNLSTTTSVFSVWVVGQSVRKKPGNTDYGVFQEGDVVLAESRRRIVVERFLDLGLDGLPGNLSNPGSDSLVGTWDDPVDPAFHPANPQYKYRIIHVEEI